MFYFFYLFGEIIQFDYVICFRWVVEQFHHQLVYHGLGFGPNFQLIPGLICFFFEICRHHLLDFLFFVGLEGYAIMN